MTLADLANPQGVSDIAAYRMYVIACAEAGKQPLPMPDWIKAGKPQG